MDIFHDYISLNMWSYVEDGKILCNTILKSGPSRDGKRSVLIGPCITLGQSRGQEKHKITIHPTQLKCSLQTV